MPPVGGGIKEEERKPTKERRQVYGPALKPQRTLLHGGEATFLRSPSPSAPDVACYSYQPSGSALAFVRPLLSQLALHSGVVLQRKTRKRGSAFGSSPSIGPAIFGSSFGCPRISKKSRSALPCEHGKSEAHSDGRQEKLPSSKIALIFARIFFRFGHGSFWCALKSVSVMRIAYRLDSFSFCRCSTTWNLCLTF